MKGLLLLAVIVLALLWGEPPKGQVMKPAYLPWEGLPEQWRESK